MILLTLKLVIVGFELLPYPPFKRDEARNKYSLPRSFSWNQVAAYRLMIRGSGRLNREPPILVVEAPNFLLPGHWIMSIEPLKSAPAWADRLTERAVRLRQSTALTHWYL